MIIVNMVNFVGILCDFIHFILKFDGYYFYNLYNQFVKTL